jgi:hypothetical protein
MKRTSKTITHVETTETGITFYAQAYRWKIDKKVRPSQFNLSVNLIKDSGFSDYTYKFDIDLFEDSICLGLPDNTNLHIRSNGTTWVHMFADKKFCVELYNLVKTING